MPQFRVTLGYAASEVGPIGDALADCDYGYYDAGSPEAALTQALHDADPTREYDAPALLSTSEGYGRGARTTDGNNNGAADRSDWWYVTEASGRLTGIYTVAEATRA